MERPLDVLASVSAWPVDHAAAACFGRATATVGDTSAVYRLASVTKPLFAYAVLVALEEGTLDLAQPVPGAPAGTTVRHLLAHASGLPFDDGGPVGTLEARRIYSNVGFDLLGDALREASSMTPADYLHEAVCAPLGMTSTELRGSPAKDGWSCVADLVRFGTELLAPTLISAETLTEATSVHFADLAGILPGFGRQDPNPWGLGFEIRGSKSPHWTGTANSPRTFGHFGQSGTMLWVDPDAGVGLVALADRPFGPWAAEAWPAVSDALLRAIRLN